MFGEMVSSIFTTKNIDDLPSSTLFGGVSSMESQDAYTVVDRSLNSLSATIQNLYKNWKRTLIGTAVIGATLVGFYYFIRKKKIKIEAEATVFMEKLGKKYSNSLYAMFNMIEDIGKNKRYYKVLEKIVKAEDTREVLTILRDYDLPYNVKDYVDKNGVDGAKELLELADKYKKAKISKESLYKKIHFITKIVLFLFIATVVFVLIYPKVKSKLELIKNVVKDEKKREQPQPQTEVTWITESLLLERSSVTARSIVFRVFESVRKRSEDVIDKISKMKTTTLIMVAIGLAMLSCLIVFFKKRGSGDEYERFTRQQLWKTITTDTKKYGVLLLGAVSLMSFFYWVERKKW